MKIQLGFKLAYNVQGIGEEADLTVQKMIEAQMLNLK